MKWTLKKLVLDWSEDWSKSCPTTKKAMRSLSSSWLMLKTYRHPWLRVKVLVEVGLPGGVSSSSSEMLAPYLHSSNPNKNKHSLPTNSFRFPFQRLNLHLLHFSVRYISNSCYTAHTGQQYNRWNYQFTHSVLSREA